MGHAYRTGGEQSGGVGTVLVGSRRIDVVDRGDAGECGLFCRRKIDAVENNPGRRVVGWLQILEADIAHVVAGAKSGGAPDIRVGIIQRVDFSEKSPERAILAGAIADLERPHDRT